ncbi:MAG: type IV secretory system conjugative DNA transfer family protein, partial [Gammaproteobacteria bacterium]
VILGKAYSKTLRLDGYEHVTVFAPTGTGKSTGITVPNLLDWQESCVVSDIKLQLFQLTSRYRESLGHHVYLWSLGAPDGITHCYNPLDIIGDNRYTRIDEIQKIASIFIPDDPRGESVWEPQARMLFVALTLYVLDTDGIPKTLSSVVKLFKSQPNFLGFMRNAIETREDLDPVCRENFMKLAEISEKTRSSVTFTFSSRFELFDNPMIVAATSRSDFDIRRLRREKMTIYVGVTNDNLVRLSPLLTVFYQQVADVLTRKIPQKDEPYGVLFLMDEFSALRRMESFHKNIGLYREYRLRMMIIIQELSQLYDIYGRDGAKVFINAKVRIAFTQNDDETCKLIESMLGMTTMAIKQSSQNISHGIGHHGSQTQSVQYVARPLMLAQEIRWMKETKALVIMQGYSGMYVNKIAWYKQKLFKQRMMGAIVVPSILPDVQQIIENNKQVMNIQMSEYFKNNPSDPKDELLDHAI